MPLTKKIIICSVVTIALLSSLSGCIFDDWLGGTSFSLVSWSVVDDEDFASLNITFSCSDSITIKLLNPSSLLVDTDYFFGSEDNQYVVLHLAESRHSVTPGQYNVKAYNSDNSEISSQTISIAGSDLSILSCAQDWWEQEVWVGQDSLFGLNMAVKNNGDVPVYPYTTEVTIDSETITGNVLPCVIMPGQRKSIDCFIYREESIPDDTTFFVSLKDIDGNTLSTGYFSINVQDFVDVTRFDWRHNGNRWVNIPIPEYMYDYYSSLERRSNEDYSLYIFDSNDDDYIDIILDCLTFAFPSTDDVEKINYIASFVQNLEYKSDDDTDSTYEYPRYPIETLYNEGGDCEDLSIIAASLLSQLGYDVALLRLPNHMAVGVSLTESALPSYDYYIEDYYFLETTTTTPGCGYIPSNYQDVSDVTAYPITSRPLLVHNWKDGHLSIYSVGGLVDSVKVTIVVENLGSSTAQNILVKGAFYSAYDQEINAATKTISSLEPGMKKEVVLSTDVPLGATTWFKTRLYYGNQMVDERQSASSFP